MNRPDEQFDGPAKGDTLRTPVIAQKATAYRLDEVERFVQNAVRRLQGQRPMFSAGQKVLLKPNLLRAARPGKCITTHPVVLEAVCRVLRDCGVSEIHISDSPALGSLEAVARKAGYEPLVKRYGARIVPLGDPVDLAIEEDVPHLKIAGNLNEYDRIVNLPKFKSHRQMTLTLGIKNLFGCVIGKRKPVLHCLVSNDKVKFGRMLVDIAKRIDPCLTVVDGIEAMEGNGPLQGTPYPLHLLSAATDMVALERLLATLVGVADEKLFVLQAARERGYGCWEFDRVECVSDAPWQSLVVSDFHLASKPLDITFNPFRLVRSFCKQFYEVNIRERFMGKEVS